MMSPERFQHSLIRFRRLEWRGNVLKWVKIDRSSRLREVPTKAWAVAEPRILSKFPSICIIKLCVRPFVCLETCPSCFQSLYMSRKHTFWVLDLLKLHLRHASSWNVTAEARQNQIQKGQINTPWGSAEPEFCSKFQGFVASTSVYDLLHAFKRATAVSNRFSCSWNILSECWTC